MAIEIGDEAPDFALEDQSRNVVRLSDFRGDKAVVVVFYPMAFTPTCEGELCAIRDSLADLSNDDVQTVAISVDNGPVHAKQAAEQGYAFPLLADFWPHGEVARAYGVFDEQAGFAHRGTFVVDKQGIVRFTVLNAVPDARDLEQYRQALAAL